MVTTGPFLTPAELSAMLADAADLNTLDPRRVPLPGVLDTDFIRTGLHYQVTNGLPPRSVRTAQDGSIRLFMEHDTLAETAQRLPRFAGQLGVPVADLRRILNEDWLPHVDVVRLPAPLRAADTRALEVRDADPLDYPAAALAALLSPCLLLTRNYKHFGALGVRTHTQGLDGVMAVVAISIGDLQVRAAVMVPALPFRAAAAGMRWATGRIGPWAWVIVAVAAAGGFYWFCQQPPERRERITEVAGQVSSHVLGEYQRAADAAHQARLQLRACMVPSPQHRTTTAAIIRQLALTPESLSAAQLTGLLDPSVRPPVAELRAYLREHDGTVFRQVRRGGFVLGSRYQLAS